MHTGKVLLAPKRKEVRKNHGRKGTAIPFLQNNITPEVKAKKGD